MGVDSQEKSLSGSDKLSFFNSDNEKVIKNGVDINKPTP